MRRDTTSLSVLMRTLHISAKELATEIHVDPSLVSRWKNGERKFNVSSEHFTNTIEFILRRDEDINYQNIIHFLKTYLPDENYNNKDAVYDALKKFFTGNHIYGNPGNLSGSGTYDSLIELSIKKGKKEIKNTILDFLDYASNLPEKNPIYIMVSLDTDEYFGGDKLFYGQWIEHLEKIVSRNQTIHFIYNNNFNDIYPMIIDLKNFFELAMTKHYDVYYPIEKFYPYDLLIVEDLFAVTSFSHNKNKRNIPLFCSANKDFVESLKCSYLSWLKRCKPILSDPKEKILVIFTLLNDIGNKKHDVYMYGATPLNFPVEPEIFEKVLQYNSFSKSKTSDLLKKYETIFYTPLIGTSTGNTGHIMLDIESSSKVLTLDKYLFMPQFLCEEEIYIPKEMYPEYLNALKRHVSSKNHERLKLSVIPTKYTSLPHGMLAFAIDDICSYVSDHQNDNGRYLLFSSSVITNDIYKYLNDIHTNLPEDSHNEYVVLGYIDRLSDNLF